MYFYVILISESILYDILIDACKRVSYLIHNVNLQYIFKMNIHVRLIRNLVTCTCYNKKFTAYWNSGTQSTCFHNPIKQFFSAKDEYGPCIYVYICTLVWGYINTETCKMLKNVWNRLRFRITSILQVHHNLLLKNIYRT